MRENGLSAFGRIVIVYMIEKEIVTVTVLRVGHRQGVYK